MPTANEYSGRIAPLLSEGFETIRLTAAPAAEFSIDTLADTLGNILEELERQHLGAGEEIQAMLASEPSEPWAGDGELSFLLYYLHNPPAALRSEIDALPALKVIWDAMAAVAAPSPFTPSDFETLAQAFAEGGMVKCNKWGDIYGTSKYEQLDAGWAWTLKNDLMNHLPKILGNGYGIADFVTHDWKQPVALTPGDDGQVRIAIIGDWGSGKYRLNGLSNPDGPASAVMDTLAALETAPDYVIHLGDTYYSGTGSNRSPANEESDNLVDMLKDYPALVRPGRCFTLNSNHEMYGGAYGYFGAALSDPLFAGQKGCSYFALEFGDWIIAGIDSAYFDPSTLYMQGGLGEPENDPQYRFLQQIKASGKRVILMSHHTGMTTDGTQPSKYLWQDVKSVLTPDYWYWGHIHLGIAYSDKAFAGEVKCRCIGHSSMPFAAPPGLENSPQGVSWHSDTPLDAEAMSQSLYYSRPRAKNGFAMLTLSESGLTEQVFEIGNGRPVWSRTETAQ